MLDLVLPLLLPSLPILVEPCLFRHQPSVAVEHTWVEASRSRVHVLVGSVNVRGSLFATVLHVPLILAWLTHMSMIRLLLLQYLVAADIIHGAMLESRDCQVGAWVVVLAVVVI